MNELQAAVHAMCRSWAVGMVEGMALGVCVVVLAAQRALYRAGRRR